MLEFSSGFFIFFFFFFFHKGSCGQTVQTLMRHSVLMDNFVMIIIIIIFFLFVDKTVEITSFYHFIEFDDDSKKSVASSSIALSLVYER